MLKINLHSKGFVSAMAFILALLVSALIIKLCGHSPYEAFSAIFNGAFVGKSAIARTLTQATPLILTGLAFNFAGKATLINLGIEGQLYLGAFAAAVVGAADFGPAPPVHIFLALGAGMLVGGMYAGFVGFLKVKFGSNEVIATIMLNSIAILVVNYMVSVPFKAAGSVTAQTEKILDSAKLMKLIPKTQLSVAIIIAILACILAKMYIDKTTRGYEIRVVGLNQRAGLTAGINVGKNIITAMFISGAIGGLAGAAHILGVDGRLIADFSPGYGYSGIAVAALAAGSPIAVIASGIIFGAIRSGSMMLDLKTNIPVTFADIIQSLVIVFVAAPLLIEELASGFNKFKVKGADAK